ncbi:MAG: pyridoxal 5'-phosphate synthase glutaminase subunit PdxT [Spirochaetota bacterium]
MRIGILALQGSFVEHAEVLNALQAETVLVKKPEHLENLDGLIIPGGESTTIWKLIIAFNLREKLVHWGRSGLPIYGTCAGLILLSEKVLDSEQESLGLIGITAKRNAFGRQLDSFEESLSIPILGEEPFNAVFIRAPLIVQTGPAVKILAKLKNGMMVAAQEKNTIVSAFHPELTGDIRFHKYFLEIAAKFRHSMGHQVSNAE